MPNPTLPCSDDRLGEFAAEPRRVGLARSTESRLREKLRTCCPSSPWIDAQFTSTVFTDDQGLKVICRQHDPSVFPPGQEKTLMVRCPVCGIFTPPYAFERGICLDDLGPQSHLGWGRSPSALAIQRLRTRHAELIDLPLEPESTEALRREIRLAIAKARKAENRRKRKEKRRKPPPTATI